MKKKVCISAKIILVMLLAMVVTTDGGKSSLCRFKLRGSGQFSYPNVQRISNFSTRALKNNEYCTITGKVPWTKDIILELTDNTEDREVSLIRNLRYTDEDKPMDWERFVGWNTIKMSGNDTYSFGVLFRTKSANFTLTYTAQKARPFLCDSWDHVRGVSAVTCENGWQLGSNCTFLSQMFPWETTKVVIANCTKGYYGEPQWNIQEEHDREDAEDEEPASHMYHDGTSPNNNSGYTKDLATFCDLSRCDVFPETIRVVSCTNGTNRGSNCTLQCKKGFVPPPHLYKEEAGIFQRLHEKVPQFWAECRFDPKYDVLPKWKPQVTTNAFQNMRNPQERYLDCMDLKDVLGMFNGLNYIDFPTARDFEENPYEEIQILQFLGEEYDGLVKVDGDTQGEILTEILSDESFVSANGFPTVMLVPDDILTDLNDKEWKAAIPMLRKFLCAPTVDSLKMALFQRIPEKKMNGIDWDKIHSVIERFRRSFSERCGYGIIDGIEAGYSCRPYCKWDKNRGGFIPCGNFKGAHIRNCLRCKLKGRCARPRFLG